MLLKKNPTCGVKLIHKSFHMEALGRGNQISHELVSQESKVAWSSLFWWWVLAFACKYTEAFKAEQRLSGYHCIT